MHDINLFAIGNHFSILLSSLACLGQAPHKVIDRGLIAAVDAVKLRAIQIADDRGHRHDALSAGEFLRGLDVEVDKGDIAVSLLKLLKLGLQLLAGIAPRRAELDHDPWCAVDELLDVIVVSDDQAISSLIVAS